MVAAMAAAAATLALAGPAAAETTVLYAPDSNARDFATGDGGWTASSEASELCVAPVTCPELTSGFAAGGGAGGAADGFFGTQISGLTGVAAESRAILLGPAFIYQGVDGKRPDELAITASHLAQVEPLLSVAGNSVDYAIELLDVTTGGDALRVVDWTALGNDQAWTREPSGSVVPGALTIGHQYRIRIITRFTYGVEVVPGGQVGYDDVALVASAHDTRPGGNPGAGSAVFDGRHLFIKLRCFGVQRHGKCWVRATALASKNGKRYTFPVQRVVRAHKGKVVRARVRFQFRRKLEQSRTVTLRSVLSENRSTTRKKTRHTKLRLINRA